MKTKTIKVVKKVPTAISAKETPKVKTCACSGDCDTPKPGGSMKYEVEIVDKERFALSMLASVENAANDLWVDIGALEAHLAGYLGLDYSSNCETMADTPPHSAFANRLEALYNSLVVTRKRIAAIHSNLEI